MKPGQMQIIFLGLTWIASGRPPIFEDLWSHTFLANANLTRRAIKMFGTEDHVVDPAKFATLPEYQKRGILSSTQQCRIVAQIHRCERLMHLNNSIQLGHVAQCLANLTKYRWKDEEHAKSIHLGFMYDFPVEGQTLKEWWKAIGSSLHVMEKVKSVWTLMRQLYGTLKLLLEDCRLAFNSSFILHDLSMESLVVQWIDLDLELPTLILQDFGSIMQIDGSEGEIPATVKASPRLVPTWPPELNHLAETVGASLPLHSYDIFSAGLLTLALGRGIYAFDYPEAFDSWWEISKLKLLLAPQSLKRLSSCIRNGHVTAETASTCVNLHAWLTYREVFSQHMRSHRQTRGQDRKKSLAQLMRCSDPKTFWLKYALQQAWVPSWHTDKVDSFSLVGQVAALLDGWMRTGFDDLILRSLSPDPSERPLPSEILTSLWFTDEASAIQEGEQLKITCPDMETPQGVVGLFASILIFLCMCIVAVLILFREVFVKWKGAQFMSPCVWEPLGGIYVMFSSLCVMAWLDYGLVYWVIMAPLGLFTLLGNTLEILKDWKMKQWLYITALLGCCLQVLVAYHVAGSLGRVISMFRSFNTWNQDPNFRFAMRNFLADTEGRTFMAFSMALKWLQFCEIVLYVSPLLPIAVLTYNLKIHRDTRQRAVSSH